MLLRRLRNMFVNLTQQGSLIQQVVGLTKNVEILEVNIIILMNQKSFLIPVHLSYLNVVDMPARLKSISVFIKYMAIKTTQVYKN